VLTNGNPPGQRTGTMLVMADRAGRPYGIGCGDTELEAANAMMADMTRRARAWLKARRVVRTWRDHLRAESEARRAEASAAFLSSPATNQP
jgi:hypothetical protein